MSIGRVAVGARPRPRTGRTEEVADHRGSDPVPVRRGYGKARPVSGENLRYRLSVAVSRHSEPRHGAVGFMTTSILRGLSETMPHTLLVAPEQRGAIPTIRDALDMAEPNSVIAIAPGDYVESIALRGREVSLVAQEPGTVTITAAAPDEPVLSAVHCRIEMSGLTLRSP